MRNKTVSNKPSHYNTSVLNNIYIYTVDRRMFKDLKLTKSNVALKPAIVCSI